MTYKEVLNKLATETATTYNAYLQSKIAALNPHDDYLADKTEQHRAEYERLEKKVVALMATIKNEDSLEAEAPQDFYHEFIK